MSEQKKDGRGGARAGAGRKPKSTADRMIEWTVTTTPDQHETALDLGDGVASVGARVALDHAKKTLKIPPPPGSTPKKPNKSPQKI